MKLGVAAMAAAAAMAYTVSATYSPADAKAMVYLAGASYCDASAIKTWSCGQACSGPLGVVSGTVTVVEDEALQLQAYVAKLADGRGIVSFRGTDPGDLEDWVDDLKSAFHTDWQGPGCDGCKVADGFYTSYLGLAPQIKQAITALGVGTVAVTGHSLGAAMAGIALLDFHASGINVPGPHYTFGHPRDGDDTYNAAFTSTLGKDALYRVVHNADIVPHLPYEWMGFKHAPREVWYTQNQTSYKVCDGSGEDPTCMDSLLFAFSISDHLSYLDLPISRMCN